MFAARFDRHMVAEARLGQLDMAAGETVFDGHPPTASGRHRDREGPSAKLP